MQRPIAVEGYPFLFMGLSVMALFAVLWFIGGLLLAGCVTAFVAFFFRNPHREVPQEKGVAVSPADGTVVTTQPCIGIFMSPFNCHINRAPVDGTVVQTSYKTGTFKAAYSPKAMETNEHHAMTLRDAGGAEWKVVQIAGWLARRIVSYVREGDGLVRGERFGLIRFGSRVDIYCPSGYQITVKEGDKVKGGKTIIARVHPLPDPPPSRGRENL